MRSLYFALRGVMGLFRYLAFGLAVILVFIGSKMLLTGVDVHIPIGFSLGIIASVLALSIIASLAIKASASSPQGTSRVDDVVEGAALNREGTL